MAHVFRWRLISCHSHDATDRNQAIERRRREGKTRMCAHTTRPFDKLCLCDRLAAVVVVGVSNIKWRRRKKNSVRNSSSYIANKELTVCSDFRGVLNRNYIITMIAFGVHHPVHARLLHTRAHCHWYHLLIMTTVLHFMLLSIVSVCSFAHIGIKWPMGVGWPAGNPRPPALIISYYFSSSLID